MATRSPLAEPPRNQKSKTCPGIAESDDGSSLINRQSDPLRASPPVSMEREGDNLLAEILKKT